MQTTQQAALSLLPLINSLDAYEAYLNYLEQLHKKAYMQLRDSTDNTDVLRNQGKLQLLDEMKELRDRLKDVIKSGRTDDIPLNF